MAENGGTGDTYMYDPLPLREYEHSHAPRWLAESARRSWWKCQCGVEGSGFGAPSVGWSKHVAEVLDLASAPAVV